MGAENDEYREFLRHSRRRGPAPPPHVSANRPEPTPWVGPIPATTTTLPAPAGTPAQTAWARKIRGKAWAKLLKAARGVETADSALRWLATGADASWWIDRRAATPARLLREAGEAAARPPTG